MVTGRVLRFDSTRGYGFIAPDEGGDDVFLHVNDLLIPESSVRAGLTVEFEVEEGDRGLKASSVRLASANRAPAALAAGSPPRSSEAFCDVLGVEEYTREVTELLLAAAPSLTADRILRIRSELVQFGRSHGWTKG
ncbi:cold-shock protein [Peterkaempfera sp. SMS 1(5)a]|uniref:cold-shock protein n=1 Tax=Peterkaempfera podocarpi TaxID=3232308 RepID=UPI00366CA8FA